MKNLSLFLAQNSTAILLTVEVANQYKGGRRFLTTSWDDFQNRLMELLKTMPEGSVTSGKHNGQYCIEW